MQAYEILFLISQLIVGIFLLLPVLNVIGAYYTKEKMYPATRWRYDYAVIITAFNNVDLVDPLIDSLLKQTYSNFHIYLVADNCGITKYQYNDSRVTVLLPPEPLNSKSGSIDYAINNFIRQHDNLIIFDADNLVHPEFISEVNKYFNRGYIAVQGERVAKNLDTKIAGIDALGEMFYNYVDRYALAKVGASSTLAGSGMAFNILIYKELMKGKNVLGGFDKILQGELVNRDFRIAYSKEAKVYDEKVSGKSELKQQRTRWLYAYFRYVRYGSKVLLKGIRNRSFNQFYFGLNHSRPPLFILALLSGVITIANIFYSPVLFAAWSALGLLFTINFIQVLRINNANSRIWLALRKIPFFIMSQVMSLFRIKQASKKFLETINSKYITIEEVLNPKINTH